MFLFLKGAFMLSAAVIYRSVTHTHTHSARMRKSPKTMGMNDAQQVHRDCVACTIGARRGASPSPSPYIYIPIPIRSRPNYTAALAIYNPIHYFPFFFIIDFSINPFYSLLKNIKKSRGVCITKVK